MLGLLFDRIFGDAIRRRSPINWLHPVVKLLRGAKLPLANDSPDGHGTTNASCNNDENNDRVFGDSLSSLGLCRLGSGSSGRRLQRCSNKNLSRHWTTVGTRSGGSRSTKIQSWSCLGGWGLLGSLGSLLGGGGGGRSTGGGGASRG
ncbi:hypothetical protein AG1IA_06086 [Rhizoctonia solani AG-1 IA]|uniref:Uncharacterized protein n=1 Tax=Thanatephorus cucumeris (strain AG1-IA) TaxID=983506 RepID=L8WP13_THACA|nr:hypothetical protein AG1IA_06086 [Rhizoctonia solani AG-1 IA]